jgi:hypothetical protein
LDSISREEIAHVKRELFNTQKKRWRGIPKNVSKEKHLVRALLKILTTILRHLDIGPNRDVLDTQDHGINIATHDGATLKPDLFHSFLDPLISPKTHEDKPSSFRQCASFIEGNLHEKRNDEDDRGQMGTYAREVFMAQSNRRFVLCFLITDNMLQFFLFDRSGALRSDKLNYHREPERACAVFAGLLRIDAASLGFDPTVFHRTPSVQCIRTLKSQMGATREIVYIVEMLLMRSYTLVGSGTTYSQVRKEGNPDSSPRYIIKDSWVTTEHRMKSVFSKRQA